MDAKERQANKLILWIAGILAAGLGAWIISVIPIFAAAVAGSFATYYVAKEKIRQTLPTPIFWALWSIGVIGVAIISWLSSLVPPIGYTTSAFLGGVVMFIAILFRERAETYENKSSAIVTPPPLARTAIAPPVSARQTDNVSNY